MKLGRTGFNTNESQANASKTVDSDETFTFALLEVPRVINGMLLGQRLICRSGDRRMMKVGDR